MYSYPSHSAVGEQICNSPGSIVLLSHTQNLPDPLQCRILCSPREETPGLRQHPDPRLKIHHRRRRQLRRSQGMLLRPCPGAGSCRGWRTIAEYPQAGPPLPAPSALPRPSLRPGMVPVHQGRADPLHGSPPTPRPRPGSPSPGAGPFPSLLSSPLPSPVSPRPSSPHLTALTLSQKKRRDAARFSFSVTPCRKAPQRRRERTTTPKMPRGAPQPRRFFVPPRFAVSSGGRVRPGLSNAKGRSV